MFCKFKHIFGKPGERKPRLLGIALPDLLFTILAALGIQYFFYPQTPLWNIFFVLFLVGILAHRLFCERTTIDRLLFK